MGVKDLLHTPRHRKKISKLDSFQLSHNPRKLLLWLWLSLVLLSKPQPNPNLNTTVGLTMKMTLQTPPPTHHHTNFSGTSRRARELKFGTDTH